MICMQQSPISLQTALLNFLNVIIENTLPDLMKQMLTMRQRSRVIWRGWASNGKRIKHTEIGGYSSRLGTPQTFDETFRVISNNTLSRENLNNRGGAVRKYSLW